MRSYIKTLQNIKTPPMYEKKRENIFKSLSDISQRIIAKNISREEKCSVSLIECYDNGDSFLYEFEKGNLMYSGLLPTTLDYIDEIEEEDFVRKINVHIKL